MIGKNLRGKNGPVNCNHSIVMTALISPVTKEKNERGFSWYKSYQTFRNVLLSNSCTTSFIILASLSLTVILHN